MSSLLQALRQASPHAAPSSSDAAPISSSFYASGELALDALSVSGTEIGSLGNPVTPAEARSLHAASTPARHGQREATLLDTRVRDTGEIGAEALTLHWTDGVLPALQLDVAQALGLPRLEARLHNLLVYGPGQFFKPHQDTEKHPGMVGTLVLVWPSAHIGGELRVRHGDNENSFASQHLQAGALRWFAFYADCRHEVLPVTEGWRIVLTFDLVVCASPAVPPPQVPAPLLAALRTQFHTEEGPSSKPWVFLLDHQYTERGLHWSLLKGEDRSRVALLRAAAQTLGLNLHLALAEIHESWTATLSPAKRRGGVETPQRDELIDEDIVLDFWLDVDDRASRKKGLRVAQEDLASFTDTDDTFLVDQAYEGYMGNYGETLDYWYRRAALVIQTPLAAEASHFITDFDAALADAVALARQGRGAELAQRLQRSSARLTAECRQRGRSLLASYAELAVALPEAAQARTLCGGFAWADLQPGDAPALARLATRWGSAWMQELLQEWTKPVKSWFGREWQPGAMIAVAPWPQPLEAFLRAGQQAGLPAAVIADMAARCLATLETVDKSLASCTPATRYASAERRLDAICGLASAAQHAPQAARHLSALLSHVQACPALYPPSGLRPFLQALPPVAAETPEGKSLHAAAVRILRDLLAPPELPADDHRLDDIEWTCRCADCSLVIQWAASPTPAALTLAIAETRRQHVQSRLADAAAPFATETKKQGSPYKLVVSKPKDLPARRRALRSARREDLAALEKAGG